MPSTFTTDLSVVNVNPRLPLSLKRTRFFRFSFSLGGIGTLAIRLSLDPHLKHLRDVCSVRILSESPSARYFSFSFLILLKYFYAEWLAPPQKLHFVWKNLLSRYFYHNLNLC